MCMKHFEKFQIKINLDGQVVAAGRISASIVSLHVKKSKWIIQRRLLLRARCDLLSMDFRFCYRLLWFILLSVYCLFCVEPIFHHLLWYILGTGYFSDMKGRLRATDKRSASPFSLRACKTQKYFAKSVYSPKIKV